MTQYANLTMAKVFNENPWLLSHNGRVHVDDVISITDALYDRIDAMTARATAAEASLAAAMEGAVRVKPLEWVARYAKYDGGREHFGTGVFGHWYGIKREKNRVWSVSHHIGSKMIVVGFYPDLEASKAAAQADYATRILAAIEPNPAAQDREALIAATLEMAAQVAESNVHSGSGKSAAIHIRALATQPQTDALAAVRREARAKVWADAADLPRYDPDYVDHLGCKSQMVRCDSGDWIERDDILAAAQDTQ